MRRKLGLRTEDPRDRALSTDLLQRMHRQRADYTNTFRALGALRLRERGGDRAVRDQFADPSDFDRWALDYRARLLAEGGDDAGRGALMDGVNPRYVLRNYLAQQAIAAAEGGDYSEIRRLRELLASPYDAQPQHAAYAAPPPDWGRELVVSCSS
jgi:uncharacterized protein YdiU (UPF0061 family)